MPHRFAIEATCVLDRMPTGIARYCSHLVRELQALALEEEGGYELVQLYRASRWRRRDGLPQGPSLSRQLWQDGWWPPRRPYAVVHCTEHRLPPWPLPMVVTCYDVYPALGISFSAPSHWTLDVYADFARRADRILFVSEHSRQDFLRLFPYDPSRTQVTHLGVDEAFRPHTAEELAPLRARYGLREPYLLFVGANHNKNLPRVLEAFARTSARHDFHLLIVGPHRPEQLQETSGRLRDLGLDTRARVVGFVAASDLPGLYAAASAVLLPSLYEGFGLPILEGMASGVPVLTSTAGSCPEVAAGHCVLVDPLSIDDIARGIDAVVRKTSEEARAAMAYARTFSWRRTAQQTLEVYRQLC